MKPTAPYKVICAQCGTEIPIRLCYCMQEGGTNGHATCIYCKQFLHINLGLDGAFRSEAWETYLDKLDTEKPHA